MKLCVVTTIIDSIQKNKIRIDGNEGNWKWNHVQGHPKLRRSRQFGSTSKETTSTFSPEVIKDWKTLGNLEHSSIEPSAVNRHISKLLFS
jgi:hypothetical protein